MFKRLGDGGRGRLVVEEMGATHQLARRPALLPGSIFHNQERPESGGHLSQRFECVAGFESPQLRPSFRVLPFAVREEVHRKTGILPGRLFRPKEIIFFIIFIGEVSYPRGMEAQDPHACPRRQNHPQENYCFSQSQDALPRPQSAEGSPLLFIQFSVNCFRTTNRCISESLQLHDGSALDSSALDDREIEVWQGS